MSNRFRVSVASVVLVAAIAAADTQTPAATQQDPAATSVAPETVPDGGMPTYIRPETPEQRKIRLGTAEDPGLDPDPSKSFWRYGRSFHISKYERRWAAYDREPGTVRPMAMVNIAYEIYQQNEKYVWVWAPDVYPTVAPAAPTTAAPRSRYNDATIAFLDSSRSQFSELVPPDAKKVVRFTNASEGLPTSGSWRNSLAVADMNKDGFLDLVAPPERGSRGTGVPAIFLGNGKGKWQLWAELQWPNALDYGSVAAADFNKDGHQDLAFAVHLRGIFVFLGDSKGKFTEVEEGLSHDYPSRRVIVTDINRDSYPDLVAISEGPVRSGDTAAGRIRGFLNRKKGRAWEAVEIADPKLRLGGDWLSVGNLNGDAHPDFLAASVYFGSTDVLYLSEGPKKWKNVASDGDVIPSLAYYFANTIGNFSSRKHQDAIVSYMRNWPSGVGESIPAPPLSEVTSIDRLTVTPEGVKRYPIARWGGRQGVWGLGSGDFDGDGNADLIYTRYNPRQADLLLGDGKGGFSLARIEGFSVEPKVNYDLKVADVNGDKKPDVIVMYESEGFTAFSNRDGSIQVYLNQGTAAVAE